MQSKLFSLIESLTNVFIGFFVSIIANVFVLPVFGFYPTLSEATSIGIIFTFISILRSYLVRRLFNLIKK